MRLVFRQFVAILAVGAVLLLQPVHPSYAAWTGIETDFEGVVTRDPYVTGDTVPAAVWGMSGRYMLQETAGSLFFELHILAALNTSSSPSTTGTSIASSPFRVLDLESTHYEGDRTTLSSELDRLSVTFEGSLARVTIGRQAITWGEAFFFNIEDLFGAFPATETNRLHKTGIDAAAVTLSTGPFSELTAVGVPGGDEPASLGLRYQFPSGDGNFSLVGGKFAQDTSAGIGFAGDYSGTKLYFHGLLTTPDIQDSFTQFVLGAERQLDSLTHFTGELYRNGWGSSDPADYTLLALTDRFREGRSLTLGRWSAAGQVSRILSPLLTGSAALFVNLNDGSTLIRVDGGYSLSNNSDFRGGLLLGLGERKRGSILRSEYGSVPPGLFWELIVNY